MFVCSYVCVCYQDAKRSRHHHVNVSWLRRTEYISTEPARFQPQTNEKIEATVGFATRRKNVNVGYSVFFFFTMGFLSCIVLKALIITCRTIITSSCELYIDC